MPMTATAGWLRGNPATGRIILDAPTKIVISAEELRRDVSIRFDPAGRLILTGNNGSLTYEFIPAES